MAGLIIRDKSRDWSVASWVYDHAWTLILRHLRLHRDSNILRQFRESARARTRCVILDGLLDSELEPLRESLALAHADLLKAGPATFESVDNFNAFVRQFEALIVMLSQRAPDTTDAGNIGA